MAIIIAGSIKVPADKREYLLTASRKHILARARNQAVNTTIGLPTCRNRKSSRFSNYGQMKPA